MRLVLVGVFGVSALLAGCDEPAGPPLPDAGDSALMAVAVNLASASEVAVVRLRVTASDLTRALELVLTIENGVARGAASVPAGPARTFTLQALDALQVVRYEGAATVDVLAGPNPPLTIVMSSVDPAGEVPITGRLGSHQLTITPEEDTMIVGERARLASTVRDPWGAEVEGALPTWTSRDTGLATVDQTGEVTAVASGHVTIVAQYGTASDSATIHIVSANPPPSGSRVLTRENAEFLLDGVPIARFGLRVANVLQSDEITERFVAAMPEVRAHGMQSFSFTIQGGRHTEDGNSAFNGFTASGALKPEIRARLTRLLDASAERGLVPVVVLFYRGRDQELSDAEAVRRAVRETMTFLLPWRHAWVIILNEPGHSGYDHAILTTADGHRELYQLAKSVDPARIVYGSHEDGANEGFRADTWGRNGIDSRMPPGNVCVEYERQDTYTVPGVFTEAQRSEARTDAESVLSQAGYFFWHASWHQKADGPGWPRFDKGGAGTATSPGVAFIWDWMRDRFEARARPPAAPRRPPARPPPAARPRRALQLPAPHLRDTGEVHPHLGVVVGGSSRYEPLGAGCSTVIRTSSTTPRADSALITCSPARGTHRSEPCGFPSTNHRT